MSLIWSRAPYSVLYLVVTPLLISTLGYNGAYDKSTLLFLLPNYVGMSLAGLLRLDSLFRGTIRARPLAALCAIDVVSQGLCQYGLAVAGSSLYIVIYSSCTMWIAIESRILIGHRLASCQWLGCAIVVLGLAFNSFCSPPTFGSPRTFGSPTFGSPPTLCSDLLLPLAQVRPAEQASKC